MKRIGKSTPAQRGSTASVHILALAVCKFLLAQILFISLLSAQQPVLTIKEIRTDGLPLVRMKTSVTRDGNIHPRQGNFSYTLHENGLPVQLDVDCPDAATGNAIVLVIDNSASIFLSLPAIGAATSTIVDSMRATDEAALITFGSTVNLLQDFTSDQNLLKTKLGQMNALGSTALYEASLAGVQKSAERGGNRFCIILTDGKDNASSVTVDSVIVAARQTGTALYTIGFGTSEVSEKLLAGMAEETGGRYFRSFSERDLADIFRTIAVEILSPYCTLSYRTSFCTDSVRYLHLEARLEGESAIVDTIVIVPSRPDTIRLRVVAQPDVAPGANTIVYIRLDPGIHTQLPLSFRFLLRYDPEFLTVNPPVPVTLGTITQNTLASLRLLRPGTLEFSAERIIPAFATGNLVGVRFTGQNADSSRPVPLEIDSVEFAAGCMNDVLVLSDTIDLCRCISPVTARLDSLKVVPFSESEIDLSVDVPDALPGFPLIFFSDIRYDPVRLVPENAYIPSTGMPAEWFIDPAGNGSLRVRGYPPFTRDPALPLYVVRFRVVKGKEPLALPLVVSSVKLYSDCCYRLDFPFASNVILDGHCDRLATSRYAPFLHPPAPNPALSVTLIRFDLQEADVSHSDVSIAVYDYLGRRLNLLMEKNLLPGAYQVSFDTSILAPGNYRIMLRRGDIVRTRPLVVVR